MKNLTLIVIIFFNGLVSFAQSVSINEDGAAANPSALLDIKSTTKGMLVPRMTSEQRTSIANPAVGLLVYDNETASFWYYKVAGWTELAGGNAGTDGSWISNGANIYNANTGNVGIGTATPVNKLTIQTPINSTGWTHVGGADSIILSEGIGGVSAAIGTSTNHALRLNSNGQGRVSIYPSGEVVVGANSVGPFGQFTVQTLNNTYGISHLGEGGNILATRMGGTSAGIGTFSNTNMRIFAGGVSCIFIASGTNNVGIGKEFPTYKLEVNGTIRSKELIVETINWPDYVFDEKYTLPALKEVELFIRQNKRLPNVQSAKEIGEKGLPLGETQKHMMEKIEELTLYMIEANKKIEELEQQMRKKL